MIEMKKKHRHQLSLKMESVDPVFFTLLPQRRNLLNETRPFLERYIALVHCKSRFPALDCVRVKVVGMLFSNNQR